MSADFWAGYLSGAIGIIIGNPLDLLKVRLQANSPLPPAPLSPSAPPPPAPSSTRLTSLLRGIPAPILTYGALNALLFVSYNRTLQLSDPTNVPGTSLLSVWAAGAVGGIATWIVSAPTEVVKCRVQVRAGWAGGSGNDTVDGSGNDRVGASGVERRGIGVGVGEGGRQGGSSWQVAKELWRRGGIRALYWGGGVTSVRDAVGYGFYFWSYELGKRMMSVEGGVETGRQTAVKVLLCGGVAGVVTWTSIFPLDVIKTRVQTQATIPAYTGERSPLLTSEPLRGAETARLRSAETGYLRGGAGMKPLGAWEVAKLAYREGGLRVFWRGLGVCSLRAFVVNAVQWTVYEWTMRALVKV